MTRQTLYIDQAISETQDVYGLKGYDVLAQASTIKDPIAYIITS